MKLLQTAERISHNDTSDNSIYQRSLFAYLESAKIIHGTVLEIGTGCGYGIEHLAEKSKKFITLDKAKPDVLSNEILISSDKISFIQMKVPPLKGVPDNYFDFVVSFQVIEHIKNDEEFLNEIYRVLKPKGKLILTTPNKKKSLTRNPWHIREYLAPELSLLLKKKFVNVTEFGVFGKENVREYYSKNKEYVRKITRFDIFNLQYLLPRFLLQIPYDILNRINRKRLLKNETKLTSTITSNDFFLAEPNDDCYDLFFISEK
ncbi:MAG: methyltransferase domain-containing protein [Crocinitomicaceae bacterium]|nr:methyltransferase domain-containing protein [Crocinitomicaceae bacterium]